VTNGWRLVTPLEVAGGDKADLVIGPFGSALKTSDFVNDGVPLIFVRDIRASDFSSPRAYVTHSKAAELKAHIALPGDVLITKMGAPPGDACIYSGQVPAVITADCIRLRSSPEFDAVFVVRALRSPDVRRQVQSITSGAAQQKVSLERFRGGIKFAAPPLEEQRRIAAILDHADALRVKRRQALAYLNSLAQSIFYDMFGDPDMAVGTVLFGDVASLKGGRNLVADDASSDSSFRVLKISAVTSGEFRPSESKPLPPGYEPPASHLVQPGDLLMSRANTAELVGAVAYVRDVPPNVALPDKVWRFHWTDTRSVPVFYHALFQTPSVRRRISRMSSGTGGSMKNISKARLENLRLPDIAPERQRLFEQRVAAIPRPDGSLLDELFSSLQLRAFRGTL
jgi:type I restriction enzyme, S subunit